MLFCDSVIVAQCTPKGSGAIAIIRFSGTAVFEILSEMSQLSSGKKIHDITSHTINHGFVLTKDKRKIDEVLFLVMHGPKTFTGENTVEINCHNNQLIIEEIIATAIHFGARCASPGEFTKRAVLNNKIDIIQAEAIHEIITASSQQHLRIALAQKEGSLSAHIATVEQTIYAILCLSQASFEFIEEQNPMFYDHILEKIQFVKKKIHSIKTYFNQQQRVKEGIRVAIIGAVNAGKSSLFNALLKKNRALVSPIPGTTRDTIEAHLFREGINFTLIDTAGIRITNDIIEEGGIQRSYQEIELADIILLLIGADSVQNQAEQTLYKKIYTTYKEKSIVVLSKNDITNTSEVPLFCNKFISVSLYNEASIALVETTLLEKCKQIQTIATPFLISLRQFNLLLSIDGLLEKMEQHLIESKAYELIASDSRQALEIIAEVTGKTIQETAMDAIFQQFCVGK